MTYDIIKGDGRHIYHIIWYGNLVKIFEIDSITVRKSLGKLSDKIRSNEISILPLNKRKKIILLL